MADDEIKILSTPKDFDPPPVKEESKEPVLAEPPPSFDDFRWQMSQ